MKLLRITTALLLLAGCSPQIQVYTDYDPDYDLWTYKTFDWGPNIHIEEGKNPLHYNELNDKRIKSAVKDQLTARGFVLTSEKPDLILHYHIIVEDQSVVTPEPYGYYYSPYWMQMHTDVFTYREGTLIIDLMDTKTNNLVWRGWAKSAVDDVNTSKKIDQLTKKAVAKIFHKFPKTSVVSTPNSVVMK
jgi:hypothetical protein